MLTKMLIVRTKKLLSIQTTVCFFMGTKVFVHLTHLKLPQISHTFLKIFIWLENLIKIHLEYYEK